MQASIPEQPPRSASASPRAMARVQAALLAEEGRLGKASGAPHKHPPVRRGSSLMLHDGAGALCGCGCVCGCVCVAVWLYVRLCA